MKHLRGNLARLIFRNGGKLIVEAIVAAHIAGLYGYGMARAPAWTAAALVVWLVVALHFWPEEKR